MEPTSNEFFIQSFSDLEKKPVLIDQDIQSIRKAINDYPNILLEIDKISLSRLKVKLLNSGLEKNDDLIQKINGIASPWRTDLKDLFKKVSDQIKCYEPVQKLGENDKLVIYAYRRTGENQIFVEPDTKSSWTALPWKVGTAVAYQKFESPSDVLMILQVMRAKNLENIYLLSEELFNKNISKQELNEGVNLLHSMKRILPTLINCLNYFVKKDQNTLEIVDSEKQVLIELNRFLDDKIFILTRRLLPQLGFMLPDLVCDYSQGRLTDVRAELGINNQDDDNKGSLACSVICMKAVQSFFAKGLPESKREIYELIDLGVDQYKKDGYQGLVLFEDVLNRLSENEKAAIKTISLTKEDGVDEVVALSFEFVNEFSGELSFLDSILDGLMKKVVESNEKKICAVLTTNSPRATNATLVIMFDENKRPLLFNSHGETYKGELKGASLLSFDTMKDLKSYIKEKLFKNEDGNIQIRLLSS